MDTETSSTSRAARKLADLLASVEVNADWPAVEFNAQTLANGLRTRRGPADEHTTLGKTLLPQTLTSLLKTALDDPGASKPERAAAIFELLRVGANLCMDHNDNRGYLLDAGFPQHVATLVEGYADALPEIPTLAPHPLPLSHLRIIKTAIGALLNSSLGYEPVQSRLIALEVPSTLLRLSTAIYPPGTWLLCNGSASEGTDQTGWPVREGIAQWALRSIAGLKDNQVNQPLFGPEALPCLVVPLKAFMLPFSDHTNGIISDPAARNSFFSTDVEVLEEVCELVESSSLDVDDVRLALARGMAENAQPPCFSTLLDFVESADYPPSWRDENVPPEDVIRWRRSVDLCKTAVIKAVVEVAGDEDNIDVLWNARTLENSLVPRLLKWLKVEHDKGVDAARDDVVICASLCLGNLARRESHSVSLVEPPTSIAQYLVPFIAPSVDAKVKHGVIGLLKHLAQSPPTRPILGNERVIQSLRTSQIFAENSDIAEIVQMSAINLVKHLCTHNIPNAITCVLDMDGDDSSTSSISQILARSRRSDSVPVKSEGARVLVNTVKALCSSAGDVKDPERQRACRLLITSECADALAQLLGRSKKHIILLNEATVSMLLLSHLPGAAKLVLAAATSKLPKEAAPPSRQNSGDPAIFNSSIPTLSVSDAQREGPETALDMMVFIIENLEGKYPAELRANVCALLGELGKNEAGAEVGRVRETVRPALEKAQTTPDSLVLSAAARKAIEAW